MSASNIRSTAIELRAAVKRTPARRVAGKGSYHLTDPKRQDVVRHEAHRDGVPEGTGRKPAPVSRAEQELPAEDAQHERERCQDDARDNGEKPSLPQMQKDLGEVHILEGPPQQRRRNGDTEETCQTGGRWVQAGTTSATTRPGRGPRGRAVPRQGVVRRRRQRETPSRPGSPVVPRRRG